MDFSWFDFVVLPILIMLARIVDVSLDTIRVIMVTKGYRTAAPIIGFFQSLIWLIAITRVMEHLGNPVAYIGYAMGFGLGTYVGMVLEGKLALGYELLRVITKADASDLIDMMRNEGYRVTSVEGKGQEGEVGILFIVVKRSLIEDAINIVKKFNPNAFYTIEDMRFVSNYQRLSAKTKNHRFGGNR
ncbi:MAG: DUF2179 domain-containing protein [Bacteroidales bacterium]|nr:DUF2179 domain-containing protein [Bacteroidales bacterium]MCF8392004.1 DUF2179 domain-containing protein [Bacteroidales bacterium]